MQNKYFHCIHDVLICFLLRRTTHINSIESMILVEEYLERSSLNISYI